MGISPEALSQLIGLIYEAALDPGQWAHFLQAFARAVDGRGTALFMHDFSSSRSSVDVRGSGIACVVNFDPAYMQSLVQHYDRTNVWAQNDDALREGVPVTSDMLFPDRKIYGTEWGSDWLRPQDLLYSMGGIVLRRGTIAVKFTTLRAPRRGAFDDEALELYRLLLPHMKRACLVHARMHEIEGVGSAAIEQLDGLPFGVMFLDAAGRSLHANAFARRMMARRDGMTLDAQGRLHAGAASEDFLLQRAINAAGLTATGTGSSPGVHMQVTRRERAPLALSVTPVRSAHAQGVYALGIVPSVVILIGDSESTPRSTPDTLVALFGLTNAEARLAVALIGGAQTSEIAEERAVAKSTIATQLKSLMHKLGARRQADVVRIVLASAPAWTHTESAPPKTVSVAPRVSR